MNGDDYIILASEKVKQKNVSFNLSENKIHNMHAWAFAYQEARKSDWLRIAANRYRFDLRKKRIEKMLAKINFFSRK